MLFSRGLCERILNLSHVDCFFLFITLINLPRQEQLINAVEKNVKLFVVSCLLKKRIITEWWDCFLHWKKLKQRCVKCVVEKKLFISPNRIEKEIVLFFWRCSEKEKRIAFRRRLFDRHSLSWNSRVLLKNKWRHAWVNKIQHYHNTHFDLAEESSTDSTQL